MRQYRPFIDVRLFHCCYSCGDLILPGDETVEHVPARVFLDRPFPENLATVQSCWECNNQSSADERFVAILLEAVAAGGPEPTLYERGQVRASAQKDPGIMNEITSVFTSGKTWDQGRSGTRLRTVIVKLARGHAMYEMGEPRYEEPASVTWVRLDRAPPEEVAEFEDDRAGVDGVCLLPEVGSRGLQRWLDQSRERGLEGAGAPPGARGDWDGWVVVQENRYRYSCHTGQGLGVRIVLRGYLGCEVRWAE